MLNATLLRGGCRRFGSEGHRLASERLRHSFGDRARSEISSECESHDGAKTNRRSQSREVKAWDRRFERGRQNRRAFEGLDSGTSFVAEKRQLLEINPVACRRNNVVCHNLAFCTGCVDQRETNFAALDSRRVHRVADKSWNFTFNLVADKRSSRWSKNPSNCFDAQAFG